MGRYLNPHTDRKYATGSDYSLGSLRLVTLELQGQAEDLLIPFEMRNTVFEKEAVTGNLLLLSERQMTRISSFFPLSHGVARVDDRQVVRDIVYVIAPAGYGPHKTLYNAPRAGGSTPDSAPSATVTDGRSFCCCRKAR